MFMGQKKFAIPSHLWTTKAFAVAAMLPLLTKTATKAFVAKPEKVLINKNKVKIKNFIFIA